MIHEVNIFYQFFQNHKEELEAQLQTAPEECKMWLTRATLDLQGERAIARQAVLNQDIVDGEIAAVFRDKDGLPPKGLQVAIYPRKSHRQLLNICDPNVDPMCFPLLFPYGETGYDYKIKHNRSTVERNKTTLKEFYKYRLHRKSNDLNLTFRCGKLFQEYVVHAWIKTESNNLNYRRQNQGKLRIAKYAGIMNHLSTNYTPDNCNLGYGRATILDSKYPVS
jgi:hypothetical protein